MTMLERIQRLRELIQREESLRDLNYSARIIGELLESNLYIANKEGVILAAGQWDKGDSFPCHLHPSLRQRLLPVARPAVNLTLSHPVFKDGPEDGDAILTIYPLIIEGVFWGSLIMIRKSKRFAGDELPIIETAALATGILLSRREMMGRFRETPVYSRFFRDAQIHELVEEVVYEVMEKTNEEIEDVS